MKKLIIYLLAWLLIVTPVFAGGNQELRQSTQQFVHIHGVAAIADGYTPVTTLLLSTADSAIILKEASITATDISSNTFVSVTGSDGSYVVTLTASDTDTLGKLTVCIIDTSLCYPIFEYCDVVTANYWDSKHSTDYLQVDTRQIGGNAVPCTTAQLVSDGASASDVVDEFETQSQADPTGFHVNVKEVNGTAQTAGDLATLIGAVSTSAAWHSTTVATPTDTKTFTIASGIPEGRMYEGFLITVTDADGDNMPEPAFVKSYASNKTVTLSTALSFTPANGDVVQFLAGFGRGSGVTIFRRKGL